MIAEIHPMGAVYPPGYRMMRPSVVSETSPAKSTLVNSHVVATQQLDPPPAVPSSQSAASAPVPAPSSSSVSSSGSLAQIVSGLVDPVTGITYSGYLTPDAQTLYQSGALVTGGNQLTSQGSALAAQGDLITGTPAPSTAQVAASAAPSGDTWSQIETWLGAQTYISGVPNGALLAGAAILGSMMFSGKKGRR